MIPSLSRRCLLCLSISRFLPNVRRAGTCLQELKVGCVQLPVFAPRWSLISPKQECGATRLRNKSIEPAWEIWSLYTLSGPARWSRQQLSCLRLFSKTCTWTGRWLTQANLQTPQQKVQHERGGMHWSIINLCHMVIKLEKQVPTEKRKMQLIWPCAVHQYAGGMIVQYN